MKKDDIMVIEIIGKIDPIARLNEITSEITRSNVLKNINNLDEWCEEIQMSLAECSIELFTILRVKDSILGNDKK